MRPRSLLGGLLPVGAVCTIVPSGSCLSCRHGLAIAIQRRGQRRRPFRIGLAYVVVYVTPVSTITATEEFDEAAEHAIEQPVRQA